RPLACQPFEDRLTERLDETPLAEDVAGADAARYLVERNAPGTPHPRATGDPRAQRSVADEGQAPAIEPGERLGEAAGVLALVESADAEVERRLPVPADLGAKLGAVAVVEPFEVDTAV